MYKYFKNIIILLASIEKLLYSGASCRQIALLYILFIEETQLFNSVDEQGTAYGKVFSNCGITR